MPFNHDKAQKLSMTPRMREAMEWYLKGKSQEESMVLAGYSPSTARHAQHQVFQHPAVVQEIERRQRKMAQKNNISNDWVIKKLRHIVESGEKDSDKLRALELLARHLGMLNDKLSVNVDQNIMEKVNAARERVRAERDQEGAEDASESEAGDQTEEYVPEPED